MCGPYCYYSFFYPSVCLVIHVWSLLLMLLQFFTHPFDTWYMCGPYCYYRVFLPIRLSCDTCVVLTVIIVLYPPICHVIHVWSLLLLQFFTHSFVTWYMCDPYCYYICFFTHPFVLWYMCGPYCYYSSLPTRLSHDTCVVLTVITVLYPPVCYVIHVWSLLLLQFFTHPFVTWYMCGPYCYYRFFLPIRLSCDTGVVLTVIIVLYPPVCHVIHVWSLLLLQFFTHPFVMWCMCGPYCYYSSLPIRLSCDTCVVLTV